MLWRLEKSVWRDGFVGNSSTFCGSMRNCLQTPRTHVIIWHAIHACNPSAVGGKDRRISGVFWHKHSSRFLSSEWSGIGYPIFFSVLHKVTGSEKKISKNQQKETWLRKKERNGKIAPKTTKNDHLKILYTLCFWKKATVHCI